MRFALPCAPPRPRVLSLLAAFAAPALTAACAFAQAGYTSDTAVGASPLAKYDATSIDNVNFENGNIFLRLPLLSYPQRGHVLRLNFNIYYNDKQWYLSQFKQDPSTYNYSGQWTYIPSSTTPDVPTAAVGAYVARDQHLTFGTDTFTSVHTDSPEPYAYCTITTTSNNYWVRTPDNSQHIYGDSQNQNAQESNTSESCNSNSSGSNYLATDGSGFNFVQPGSNGQVIAGPDGELYSIPTSTSNQETVADLQGNSITLGSDGWHDTAGRIVPGSYTGPGTANGTASSWPITGLDPIPGIATAVANTTCPGGTQAARVWTVPSFSTSGSGTANYYLCYTPVSYSTAFNAGAATGDTHYPAGSIQEASGTTPPLLTAVMLPDGTSYRFGYDQYLSLNSISLPTGGTISYTWQTVPFIGSPSTPVSRALKSRTFNPGNGQPVQTWTYHFPIPLAQNAAGGVYVNYPAWSVVTDPAGNDVEHQLGGGTDQAGNPVFGLTEEQRVTYSGCGPHDATADRSCSGAGTALQTDQYTLQGWGGRSGTSGYIAYDRVIATQTTVPSSGGSLVRKTVVTPVPNYGTCTLPNVSSGQGGYNPTQYQNCYTTGQTASVATYGWGAPGSGAPGPLLNTASTTYQWQAAPAYLSANLINPVKSTVMTNGSGMTAAETDYGYDEGNGSPAGVLGNQTSATTVLVGGASPKTQTVYNGQGQPTSVVDARNNATSISYQCSGSLPLAMTNPLNQATQFSYDCGSGLLASITDPNGKATRYNYDALGRRTDIFGPSSAQNGGAQAHTSYAYAPASGSTPATVTTVDPIGLTTKTMYDGLGRAIHAQVTSDPSGTDTLDTNYDVLGRVASVSTPYRSTSDPTYGITKYSYDALGRTIAQTDPTDAQAGTGIQSWNYDGNAVTYTNENAFLWKRTYDALGRLTQVLEPGSTTPNAAPTLESDYTYDALGNLTCVEQHGGVSGTGCSAPASSDASSQWRVRRYAYDSLSRLTAVKNPESGTVSYSYDANGNIQTKTDARGVVTSSTWDALNRLSAKSYANDPSNTPAVSFNYDAPKQGWSLPSQTYPSATPGAALNQIGQASLAGRLSWASNGSSTEVYGYDEAGRMTLKSICTPSTCPSNDHYDMHAIYDLAGNPTFTDLGVDSARNAAAPNAGYYYGGLTMSYAQSGQTAGRLLTGTADIVDGTHPATIVSGLQYSPLGGKTAASYGSVYGEGDTYSPRGWPVSGFGLVTGFGQRTATLAHDLAGNITQLNDSLTGPTQYTVDQLNRLLSAANSTSSGAVYAYDNWGNLTSRGVSSGSGYTYSLTMTPQNQVSQAGSTDAGFIYDAAGDILADGLNNYSYDGEGRLNGVNGQYQYQYAPDGTRIAASNGGTIIAEYLYGMNGKLATILDTTGKLVRGSLYGDGMHLADYTAGTGAGAGSTVFHLADQIGSLINTVDQSGNVIESCGTQPFGEALGCTPSIDFTEVHYADSKRDQESNLDSFGARYYSSTVSRWALPDSINVTGDRMMNPSNTLNKYAYAANNPIRYVDPDGKDITVFYEAPDLLRGSLGHTILLAYNQATGDSAIKSFGPDYDITSRASALIGAPSVDNFGLETIQSPDQLRAQFSSITLQTSPEEAQTVIAEIRNHPDGDYRLLSNNCTTTCSKLLRDLGRTRSKAITPKGFFSDLYSQYGNPSLIDRFIFTPKPGANYGQVRSGYDPFTELFNTEPLDREKVTVTIVPDPLNPNYYP